MSRDVNPGRFAVVAGVLVSMAIVAAFAHRGTPVSLIGLFGGPRNEFERDGRLSIRYQLPGGGGERIVEVAQVTEADADDVVEELAGGLAFHPVFDGRHADDIRQLTPVTTDVDQWTTEDGQRAAVRYLRGTSRRELEGIVAAARERGWHTPPGTAIAFERIDVDGEPVHWRSHEIEAAAPIDRSMIASASAATDPDTLRQVVLIGFTEAGAQRFCELTGQIRGRKLAIVVGSRVRSAPLITSEICDGQARIDIGHMGDSRAQRDASALASLLRDPRALPAGSVVLGHEVIPPVGIGRLGWLAPLVIAIAAGALAAALAYLVIRLARPRYRTAEPRPAGRFPWRRALVTLLAPLAACGLPVLSLHGVANEGSWSDGLSSVLGQGTPSYSVVALGLTPVITAFIAVELVALVVPRLRWRRHDARGRIGLGQATAVLAVAFALVHGWFVASYLHSFIALVGEGYGVRIVTALTMAAGTMLLTVVAGVIREHGLGNGYGALIASGTAATLIKITLDVTDRSVTGLGWLLAVAAVAAGTWCALRWRIGGTGDRAVALRVPSSGLEALAPLGGIGYLVVGLPGLAIGAGMVDLWLWLGELQRQTWAIIASVCVFVPVWSWLFARPALVARVALQAGFDPPARRTWLAATAVSFALSVAVLALALATASWLGIRPLGIIALGVDVMIATAVVLDIVDDARARRAPLAPVWAVHQIQYLGVIERVLAARGIPCHVHAANLRTLLAFFGPWAPAIVLVPTAHAELARQLLNDALRPAAGQIPVARVA